MRKKTDIKILISSQDIGASKTLAEFLKYLDKKKKFKFFIVCSKVSQEVYKEVNYKDIIVYSTRANQKQNDLKKKILHKAENLLNSIDPDILLVGLSGPDVGIDEALIYKSQSIIPSFAYQDFWGDMNYGFGRYPGTVFVLDNFAYRITKVIK